MDSERRFARGFIWGVVATVAMSVLMVIGLVTGLAPMPRPVPVALVGETIGGGPEPLIMAVAMAAHLAYGGVWGGVFASLVRPVTVGKGLALGVGLWLLMQVAVLPYLGWGLFGAAVTPAIAAATLALHLVYGATYGALARRRAAAVAHDDTGVRAERVV
ncbi:MAG: DUF6789 family protein [Gemmatimonadota bacterium]